MPMDTGAPWRALEASQERSGEATPGRSKPVALLLMLAVAVLVAGSLAAVALVKLQPAGQVQVVGGPNGSAPVVAGSQAMVVVQVAGAVVRPGVYSLPTGSRVEDAIHAAGGYSTDVDPRAAEAKLNLAAKLQDAQSIVVPRRGEAQAASSGTGVASAPSGPLNLNTATSAQLDALPGIGPATATKIIASRQQLPFTSVNDLTTRKLVSAATLAKFRDQVTV
jgi:competence protein ComEA